MRSALMKTGFVRLQTSFFSRCRGSSMMLSNTSLWRTTTDLNSIRWFTQTACLKRIRAESRALAVRLLTGRSKLKSCAGSCKRWVRIRSRTVLSKRAPTWSDSPMLRSSRCRRREWRTLFKCSLPCRKILRKGSSRFNRESRSWNLRYRRLSKIFASCHISYTRF